jgi:hypothetical protein
MKRFAFTSITALVFVACQEATGPQPAEEALVTPQLAATGGGYTAIDLGTLGAGLRFPAKRAADVAGPDRALAAIQVRGPRGPPFLADPLSGCVGTLGDHPGAGRDEMRVPTRLTELVPLSRDALNGSRRLIDLAEIYSMVGEVDAAIDILEEVLSVPSLMTVQRLRLQPTWDPLRDHPRFQALLPEARTARLTPLVDAGPPAPHLVSGTGCP